MAAGNIVSSKRIETIGNKKRLDPTLQKNNLSDNHAQLQVKVPDAQNFD